MVNQLPQSIPGIVRPCISDTWSPPGRPPGEPFPSSPPATGSGRPAIVPVNCRTGSRHRKKVPRHGSRIRRFSTAWNPNLPVFPRHGSQILQNFHAMEPTFVPVVLPSFPCPSPFPSLPLPAAPRLRVSFFAKSSCIPPFPLLDSRRLPKGASVAQW